MTRIVPLDPLFFAGLMRSSGELAQELALRCGPDGVACAAMDAANVALFDWRIGPEYFAELPPAEVVLEVLSKDFVGLFRGVDKRDRLVLGSAAGFVSVTIERGSSTVRRRCSLMSFDRSAQLGDRSKLLEREQACVVACSFKVPALVAAVKEFKAFEEASVVLDAVDGEALLLSASGDLAGVDVSLKPLEVGERVAGSGRVRMAFPYLVHALGFLEAGFELASLRWSPDRPLYVRGSFKGADVVVVVAPRVQNE